jgi:hypothetical protein
MPILTLVLTSNTQTIELTGEYITPLLIMQNVCVNFTDGTNTQSILAIESELFSHGNSHNNLCNGNVLVPLKLGKQSSMIYTNFRINEAKISQTFLVTLYNGDCATLFDFTKCLNVILTFTFEQTSLL